jgi:hypothetical protein
VTDERAVKADPLADLIPAVETVFAVENFSLDLVQELVPLFVDHYHEIATWQDIELKPRWERYELLKSKGFLRVHVARKGGRAIAYSAWILDGHLHYADSMQATNDVIYLQPDQRGKFLGYRFIRWSLEQLKAEKIQSVALHIKLAHNWGPMAERLGFFAEETIYRMRLDR